ncbi:helix-turn-helix transcriptional regulator [Bifidobacterium pseudolongum]|uniref:helix-turn-helix transcriptional regulator n=1 Tax=Bifidobacterium pseudolongum TaxID=1694 RepID=UPI0010D14372|nr:hypothetical protein [Bifidobacterium pseudolongum]RYQ75700.1 hypothetical protein PG2012B_0181 [Bifidobacterium pseudolongum subsp. globosum]
MADTELKRRDVATLIAGANLTPEPYISIDEALSLMPGVTKQSLAHMRFKGEGPNFYKPTARTVLYKASEVLAWADATRGDAAEKEDSK